MEKNLNSIPSEKKKIVFVDQDECTSCNQCADNLPEVFAMDDEELAYVHNTEGADKELIQEEIDQCPGECIHWKNIVNNLKKPD